jgi:hypothetical protein
MNAFFALRHKRKLDLDKQELKQSRVEAEHSFESPRCRFCVTIGHLQKECDGFKDWLAKRGNHKVLISFNYESLMLILEELIQAPCAHY